MAKQHKRLSSGHGHAGQGSQSARIIVGPKGGIDPAIAPEKLVGHNGDLFMWSVENNTDDGQAGVQIIVTLTDFLVKQWPWDAKGQTPPVMMFDWKTDNPVIVDPGMLKIIVGKAAYPFGAHPPLFVPFSYTIIVQNTTPTRGSVFDIDYDPDGEIKP